LIDHTIEWSRSYFHTFFGEGSADFCNYIKAPAEWLKQAEKDSKVQAGSLKERLDVVAKYCTIHPEPTLEKFVQVAR
jgi:hypothetical protein